MPTKLKGSGGHIIAEITDEQSKKADLGVGELFLHQWDELMKTRFQIIIAKNVTWTFQLLQK